MPLTGPPLAAPVPVPDLLRAGLTRAPDEIAIASVALRCTWRDLDRLSDNLAGNYLGLGLRPGDRVASLMPNRIALVIHYIACLKAGLVGVPLNYRYTPTEIDRALSVSGASLLIAHAERAPVLAESRQAAALVCGTIYHEAEAARGPSLQPLMEKVPAGENLSTPGPHDPAFIFFTSGSTGPAKGVTHSREGIGWLLAVFAAILELTPADGMLAASSMSHIGGFGFSIGALAAGVRTIIPHSLESRHILQLLREQHPTVLWMQPALLFQLIRDPEARAPDFRSLRHCRAGSDKVPRELARGFADLAGFPISEGMGMTEVGPVTGQPPHGIIKVGSIGQAAPGMRLSIRDENGREVPTGTEGRLFISTPCLTTGYWGDPAATAEVIREDWLDSGDVVKADNEGYLTFCGRRKQLIVHDGSNIAPQEVEDALMQHAAVAAAGVIGITDPIHGENVHAFVALKPGKVVTEPDLIDFARARIGYKAPETISFMAELPLNNDKIDRAALKRKATEAAP